jgi:predicted GNAT family N-acyltransferase
MIEKLNESDIPDLIALSASVGWDYNEDEIRTVLAAGVIYGWRNDDKRVMASAAILAYDNRLASIGMVIVHPDYRGYGLGKTVTQTCIDSVPSRMPVMLIATPDGKPMYEKMGFRPVDCVHKYLCDGYRGDHHESVTPEMAISPVSAEHFHRIVELDRLAVGANRSAFLQARMRQAKNGVVAIQEDGEIVGYGFSIQGSVNLVLGPIVAPHASVAAAIVNRLASGHQGKLRIDVPSGHDDFLRELENRGFHQVSQPPVMLRNAAQLPPRNGTLFGIAAQIFG